MDCISDEESSVFSSEDKSDFSESSDESFFSASDDFYYDESVEPLATEQEAAAYSEEIAREEEEEEMLWSRFSGEEDVENWCKCSNCSLESVVRPEECRCCTEVRRCEERMEELEREGECITEHPGFADVCLSRWVLHTAGIGLKTKQKHSYTTMLSQGDAAENEFLRAVAYRQFVRLVWEYVGASRRLPLPACVYNKIRQAFPTNEDHYHGYEEDD